MKKITLTITAIFVLNILLYSQTIYNNSAKNYSITIPNGWKQISQNIIDKISQNLGTEIDAGFSPVNRSKSDWPVPIFTTLDTKKISKDEFEQMALNKLKSFKNMTGGDIVNERYGDLIKNFQPGNAYYDKQNKYLVMMYSSNSGHGTVINMGTLFYTPNGILSIFYSEYETNFKTLLNNYIGIISSLKK